MSNISPFTRRSAPMRVPRGEVLGTYENYSDAQKVVHRLTRADFPIAKIAIVGNNLTSVEVITGKRSWNRAARQGLLTGAWFGIFLGLLFSLLSPDTFTWQQFAAAVFIGAALGLFLRLISYGVSRRNRDFESTTQVVAANYQIVLDGGQLSKAQEILAAPAKE